MGKLGGSLAGVLKLSILILASVCLGCRTGSGGGSSTPGRDIKTVMEAHVDSLMAIPGVVGVAIGELKDARPCILVLVVKKTAENGKLIPAEIEGYPVKIEESGEIRPMPGDSAR